MVPYLNSWKSATSGTGKQPEPHKVNLDPIPIAMQSCG